MLERSDRRTEMCLNPHCITPFCPGCTGPQVIVGVCREDNPRDVDAAYGEGTYARLVPRR